MPTKKYCTTPRCTKFINHIGNCSGKDALPFTRTPRVASVQKKKRVFRKPPGPVPRDKDTHVQKVWNPHLGKWITPIISTEDIRITADSLIAMASPVPETNVVQDSIPQTQVIIQPNVVAPSPQVVAQLVLSQPLSFASLFQQLGAQMDSQMARIVALESRVSTIETARFHI